MKKENKTRGPGKMQMGNICNLGYALVNTEFNDATISMTHLLTPNFSIFTVSRTYLLTLSYAMTHLLTQLQNVNDTLVDTQVLSMTYLLTQLQSYIGHTC